MTFRNPLGSLGSDTALSLAANPVALPVMLTAAGVAVTIGAAAWSYHAYTAYQEKKHKKEIEDVNKLHKEFLEKIVISDYNEIQGFPPVFKLLPNEKSSTAESMHFTDEQINAIGSTLPRGTDIALYKYRELILNAILELRSYYLDRNKPHDVTAGVLSYLLYMLESKCLNFAGFEYDIAYLNALAKFINAYASLEGTTNSQHFSRLTPVRGYLNDAMQELQKHKEALSLKDMIGELSNCCVSASKKMLRTFVKLISPEKKWKYINTATHDELAKGILRRKYVHTQVKGIKLMSDQAVTISESNFSDWLKWLLKYFEESINPDSPMTVKDILSPDKIFFVPDFTKVAELKNKSSHKQKGKQDDEITKTKALLNSIRHVFAECENYITMKVDPKTIYDSPKFIHVLEDNELIERTGNMASFATLIHKIISLQYLCVYLLKSIKQLGEIYAKNPHHFCLIFSVVEELCNQIQQLIDANRKAIIDIQQKNRNIMQLEAQELFPEQTIDMLDTAYVTISKISKRVQEYRNKVAKDHNSLTTEMESVKQEMFEVAKTLATIYNIRPGGSVTPSTNSQTDESLEDSDSNLLENKASIRPKPHVSLPPTTSTSTHSVLNNKLEMHTNHHRLPNSKNVIKKEDKNTKKDKNEKWTTDYSAPLFRPKPRNSQGSQQPIKISRARSTLT